MLVSSTCNKGETIILVLSTCNIGETIRFLFTKLNWSIGETICLSFKHLKYKGDNYVHCMYSNACNIGEATRLSFKHIHTSRQE